MRGWSGCTGALALAAAALGAAPVGCSTGNSAGGRPDTALTALQDPSGPAAAVLTTERDNYAPGDSIPLHLEIVNPTDQEIAFEFATGQRYDFSIENEAGEIVWRWSDGLVFMQMLGQEKLGPGKKLVYSETVELDLAPGSYSITATLVATNHPLSATAALSVR